MDRMTATELDCWNYFYLSGTRNNVHVGEFDMRHVHFAWPFLFACQISAAKLAHLAVEEFRAGRLSWPNV